MLSKRLDLEKASVRRRGPFSEYRQIEAEAAKHNSASTQGRRALDSNRYGVFQFLLRFKNRFCDHTSPAPCSYADRARYVQ